MKTFRTAVMLSLAGGGLVGLAYGAENIPLPNRSFESPAIVYVGTYIDSWQKTPKPEGYVESGGFTWDQLTGVFLNTPPTSSDHIDNCDGRQAIWLFAVPEVGLFQDYESRDWNDAEPTHAFDVQFEPGKSYRLTVGVIGGGGGMLEGATLSLSLYYRDAQGEMINVATTEVAHNAALFPNRTHLEDVEVDTPVVRAGDPWAGKKIGVRMLSTVSPALEGGYWDLDHVRLVSQPPPALDGPTMVEGGFQFTVSSEPGARFEVLASDVLSLPIDAWPAIQTLTNVSGTVSFIDGNNGGQRFYQLRQVP
jgi:hypothetical protein